MHKYFTSPTALSAETPLSPNPLASTARLDSTRRSGNAWVLPRYTVRLPLPPLPPTLPLLIVLVRREGNGIRRSSPPPYPSSDRKYRLHSSVPLRPPAPLLPKSTWAWPLVPPEPEPGPGPRHLSPSRSALLSRPPPSWTIPAGVSPASSDRLLCLRLLPGNTGTSEAVARSSSVMSFNPASSCTSASESSDARGSLSTPRLGSCAESPRREMLLPEEQAAWRYGSSERREPATVGEPRAGALVGRPVDFRVAASSLFSGFLVVPVPEKPTSSSVRPITPGYATWWPVRSFREVGRV